MMTDFLDERLHSAEMNLEALRMDLRVALQEADRIGAVPVRIQQALELIEAEDDNLRRLIDRAIRAHRSEVQIAMQEANEPHP